MLPSQCLRRYGHRRCRERLKKEKRTRGMMRLQEDSLYHLRPRDSPILLSIPSSLSKNRQNIKAFPTSSSSSLQSSLSSPVSYSPSSSSSSSSSSCPSFFFSRRCSFLLSSLSLSNKGPAPAALRHSGVAAFFHTQRGETRRRRSISSSPLSSLGTNTSTHVCTAKPLQTTSSASFTENQIKERKEEEGYLLSSNRRHPSYLLTPSLSSEEYSSYSFSPSSSCCLLPFSPHSFSSFSPRFPSFSRSFSSSYIMSRHAPLKASFAASISSSSSSSVSSSSYSLRLLSSRLSSHRCSLGPRKVISSSLISRTQAMDLFHPFVFHSSSSSNPLLLVQHSGSPSSFLSSSLERSFSRSFSSRPFSSSSSPREKRGEEANEEIETFQSISEAPPRGRGGRRKRQTAMSHRSCREDDSEGYLNNVEERAEGYPGVHTLAVTREQFHDGSRGLFRPHPFNRRFARVRKPVFPIEARNLRLMYKRKAKRRRGRGDKSNAKGIRWKHVHQQAGRYKGPRSRTFEGGKTPLYKRIPKWPEAWLQRQRRVLEPLNLAKLRTFIEKGRLDARYPITQRHLHDSRCVKVKNGVRLFNVNDYPFPYKISIEVSGADQSSIDAIRRVGGEVIIVYRNRLNLRAHVKPYKFEVLPRTARPNLEMLHYLEKMRARGCIVKYIKPLWLIEEEKHLKTQLAEFDAEARIARGEGVDKRPEAVRESIDDLQDRLLKQYRLRETLAADLEEDQQHQRGKKEEEEKKSPR